jgi:hypothetical protein
MANEAVAKLKVIYPTVAFADTEAQGALFREMLAKVTVTFEDIPYRKLLRSKFKTLNVQLKPDAFLVKNLVNVATWGGPEPPFRNIACVKVSPRQPVRQLHQEFTARQTPLSQAGEWESQRPGNWPD